jgi:dephospho-CoA kinase
MIKSSDAQAIIIDAPLLFESKLDKECDVTVCVIADDTVRMDRIIRRDHISEDVARSRIANQIKNEELIKLCDHVLENNSDEKELRMRIAELYKKLFNN